MSKPIFKPGDILKMKHPRCEEDAELRREIVDLPKKGGYGWKHPEYGDTTPSGDINYYLSLNSSDPELVRWEVAIDGNVFTDLNKANGRKGHIDYYLRGNGEPFAIVRFSQNMTAKEISDCISLVDAAPNMRALLERCRKDGVLPQKLEIEIDRLMKTLR